MLFEFDSIEVYPVGPAAITPMLDSVWLKSVARPFVNRRIDVSRVGDIRRPSRTGVFDVRGREKPVVVSEVRGSRRWDLTVRVPSEAEADDLELALLPGDVMLLHVPRGRRVPGGYVTIGETSERRFGPATELRHVTLPCTAAAAPGPDVVAAASNCQTLVNTYATCQDLLEAHPTCASVVELIGSPTDVVVS